MSVTADQVVVQFIANTDAYLSKMREASGAAAQTGRSIESAALKSARAATAEAQALVKSLAASKTATDAQRDHAASLLRTAQANEAVARSAIAAADAARASQQAINNLVESPLSNKSAEESAAGFSRALANQERAATEAARANQQIANALLGVTNRYSSAEQSAAAFSRELSLQEQRAESVARANQSAFNSVLGVRDSYASAAPSAEAFTREIERQEDKFNPLAAAIRRNVAEQRDLTLAHQRGVVSTSEYTIQMERLQSQAAKMRSGGFVDVFQRASAETRNLQFTTSNLAAQFNDIGVTAAMGMQPWLIALQQGTQISQAFAGQRLGQVASGIGAAFMSAVSPVSLLTIGLVAGVAVLIQWGMSLLNVGFGVDTLGDKIDKLMTSARNLRDANDALTFENIDELVRQYGGLTTEIMQMVEAQRQLAELGAMRDLRDALEEIQNFAGSSLLDTLFIDETTSSVLNLQRQLRLTRSDAEILYEAFASLGRASGLQEQIDALTIIRMHLVTIANSTHDGADAALDMAGQVNGAEQAARMLLALTNNLPGALDAAADSASEVADELMRAVGAAERLANASVDDLRFAEINAQYRTDPVARAGALAAARFDSAVETQGYDAHLFAERRALTIANAEAAARLNEETRRLNELDRESSGGGGRERNELLRERDQLMRDIMTPMEQYAEQLERIQVLLDNELISEDVAERARTRLASLLPVAQEVAGHLRSAFTGLFTDAEGALKRLAQQLAMIILQMQLSRMFPSIFGASGLIPLGYDRGGYTGPGGVTQPAGIVHKGEVVWSQRDVARAGGVSTVEAMRLGHRGYAGGGVVSPKVPQYSHRSVVTPPSGEAGQSGGPMAITVNVSGASGDDHVIALVHQGVRQGLAAYDRALPGRVRGITTNPRRG